MSKGIVMIIAGVWIITQTTMGGLVQRAMGKGGGGGGGQTVPQTRRERNERNAESPSNVDRGLGQFDTGGGTRSDTSRGPAPTREQYLGP